MNLICNKVKKQNNYFMTMAILTYFFHNYVFKLLLMSCIFLPLRPFRISVMDKNVVNESSLNQCR